MQPVARAVERTIYEALADTPVVVLNGARQVGKTTLVKGLRPARPTAYVTLDDPVQRMAATEDPRAFVDRRVSTWIIDEAQVAPPLFRAVKAEVDRDRQPGRFLLTGSSRLLAAPEMADAFVGRVEIVELWPLSERELTGASGPAFVDRAFAGAGPELAGPRSGLGPRAAREGLIVRTLRGGYPEVVARSTRRRPPWFEGYVTTILQRTVADIADLQRAAELPRMLRLAAARTAQELNVSALGRELGLPERTASTYLAHLTTTFLVQLLETFAVAELRAQLATTDARASLSHFRDRGGAEVDIVLEHPDGRIVALEVKATASPTVADLRGLRFLNDRAGPRVAFGAVLCGVDEPVAMGAGLWALPFSALWR